MDLVHQSYTGLWPQYIRAIQGYGISTSELYILGYGLSTSKLYRDMGLVHQSDLTIRPIAHKGYGSIAHEAKQNGLLTRGP